MKNRYIGVRFAELKDQRSEAWRGGAVRFGVSAGGAEVALGDGGFGRGSAFLVEYPRGKNLDERFGRVIVSNCGEASSPSVCSTVLVRPVGATCSKPIVLM